MYTDLMKLDIYMSRVEKHLLSCLKQIMNSFLTMQM